MLNEVADAAAAVRDGAKGWKPGQVRAAIREALDSGHPPALVAERLAQLAADARTMFPTRLRTVLDIEAAETARKATQAAASETPPWAEGAVRYVDSDRPKCRTHPGHPADNCAPCKLDARTADDLDHYLSTAGAGDATTPAVSDPRAAARAAAAAAKVTSRTRRADKRPTVPRQSTSVDELAAAVAELLPAPEPAPEPDTDPASEPAGVAA